MEMTQWHLQLYQGWVLKSVLKEGITVGQRYFRKRLESVTVQQQSPCSQ